MFKDDLLLWLWSGLFLLVTPVSWTLRLPSNGMLRLQELALLPKVTALLQQYLIWPIAFTKGDIKGQSVALPRHGYFLSL